MKITPRPLWFALLLSLFASAAQAHPGHDGHELTWDFGHLVAHPVATLLCVAVLVAATWTMTRLTRGRRLKRVRR